MGHKTDFFLYTVFNAHISEDIYLEKNNQILVGREQNNQISFADFYGMVTIKDTTYKLRFKG